MHTSTIARVRAFRHPARRRVVLAATLFLGVVLSTALAGAITGCGAPIVATAGPAGAPFKVIDARKIEQVIGDFDFESLRPTRQQTSTRFGLSHTDLGAPFEHQGKLWLLFGDSDPESPGWDARHDDAIAHTDATRIEDFRLDFVTRPGNPRRYANPRIDCPREGRRDCIDLGTLNVPVAGLGDGKAMFVWFTADSAGRSLLARSEDGGLTFEKVFDFGRTHFIDVQAQRARGPIPGLPGSSANEWVLVFGSGDHAHNDVYLAAAPIQRLREGDRSAVRFLAGIRFEAGRANLFWSAREADAVPIFKIEHNGAVPDELKKMHAWGLGEPLVHYDARLGAWVATYNADLRQTVRLRVARDPWGPWSPSVVLFDPRRDYGRGPAQGRFFGDGKTERLGAEGALYGPYVLNRFTRVEASGRVHLYWLLSTWQPYTVVLMHSTLDPVPGNPYLSAPAVPSATGAGTTPPLAPSPQPGGGTAPPPPAGGSGGEISPSVPRP